jgi:hypothetical protein
MKQVIRRLGTHTLEAGQIAFRDAIALVSERPVLFAFDPLTLSTAYVVALTEESGYAFIPLVKADERFPNKYSRSMNIEECVGRALAAREEVQLFEDQAEFYEWAQKIEARPMISEDERLRNTSQGTVALLIADSSPPPKTETD